MKLKASKLFTIIGITTLLTGLTILLVVFWPQISMNITYLLQEQGILENKYIQKDEYEDLVNTVNSDNTANLKDSFPNSSYLDFGILIPKINADAPVIENVDALNSIQYNDALKDGIAHANTSSLPNMGGNMFLFAHSGRNFYDSINVNVQFYMLDKLTSGDLIIVNYQGNKYIYQVINFKIVKPTEAEYMYSSYLPTSVETSTDKPTNSLILMSCWPAGVNYKRQIVEAELIKTF